MEFYVGIEKRVGGKTNVAGEPRRYITRSNMNNKGDGNNDILFVFIRII